jgi:hypothetical protein
MNTQPSKKITKVLELFSEAVLRENQYRNIRHINNCLPKHKARRIEAATAGYTARRYSAKSAFKAALRKLSLDERVEFQQFAAQRG